MTQLGLTVLINVVDRQIQRAVGAAGGTEVADLIRNVLAAGALEGRAFTAEAVARALGRSSDQVIDLLDDCVTRTDGRAGVVDFLGFTEIQDPLRGDRSLSRYRFVSARLWLAFGATSDALPRGTQSRLLEALMDCYHPRESLIANSLAKLASRLGRPWVAAFDQITRESNIEAWRVEVLKAADKAAWTTEDYATAAIQLATSGAHSGAWDQRAHCFDLAHTFSLRSGDPTVVASVLSHQAAALDQRGFLEEAEQLALQGVAIARDTGLRDARVTCCTILGGIFLRRGETSSARTMADEALAAAGADRDVTWCVASLLVSRLDAADGNLARASERARSAVEVVERRGSPEQVVVVLCHIAEVEIRRRSDLDGADHLSAGGAAAGRALSIANAIGFDHGKMLASFASADSALLSEAGDVNDPQRGQRALELCLQSLRLAQELGDLYHDALVLEEIAVCFRLRGESVTALKFAAPALRFLRHFGSPRAPNTERYIHLLATELGLTSVDIAEDANHYQVYRGWDWLNGS